MLRKIFISTTMFMFILSNNISSSSNVLDTRLLELHIRIEQLEKKLMYTNVIVTVTAYSPCESETNVNPYETASLLKPRPWTIAVSRDLFDNGWIHGKYVYLDQIGRFKILDLMNKRYEKRVDIFFTTKEQAIEFGIKHGIKAALLNI